LKNRGCYAVAARFSKGAPLTIERVIDVFESKAGGPVTDREDPIVKCRQRWAVTHQFLATLQM
jgi:hypothetical protein